MKKIITFMIFLILYLLIIGIVSLPAATILWLLNKTLSLGIPFSTWYIISFGALIISEIYDEYMTSA